jgi:hypothetical protein
VRRRGRRKAVTRLGRGVWQIAKQCSPGSTATLSYTWRCRRWRYLPACLPVPRLARLAVPPAPCLPRVPACPNTEAGGMLALRVLLSDAGVGLGRLHAHPQVDQKGGTVALHHATDVVTGARSQARRCLGCLACQRGYGTQGARRRAGRTTERLRHRAVEPCRAIMYGDTSARLSPRLFDESKLSLTTPSPLAPRVLVSPSKFRHACAGARLRLHTQSMPLCTFLARTFCGL